MAPHDENHFVNPYSFVPLPKAVLRTMPLGHSGDASGMLCGRVEVTWTLQTPLLLPKGARAERWLTGDGRISIPGSSIKGAVRSLHETMFNGCLRVVNEEFTPSYRMSAREAELAKGEHWRLAVVAESTAGRPTRVRLCDESSVVWVDGTALFRVWPQQQEPPTSGDRIKLRGAVTESSLGRTEMRNVSHVTKMHATDASDGTRILLVTSVQARHAKRKDPRAGSVNGRAFWATGELTDDVVDVTAAAAEGFRISCEGSDDLRKLQAGADDAWRRRATHENVTWWGRSANSKEVVARRARASGYLFPGDAIWVRLNDGGQVAGIRLSQIWRIPGRRELWRRLGTPRDDTRPGKGGRWPTRLHACRLDGHGLCLTCSIFGAADTGDTDSAVPRSQGPEQRAYAAHVRFGSARSAHAEPLIDVPTLAPLGAPHPGAGMFYLAPRPLKKGRTLGDVASRWGITEQDDPPAEMAGRKFYWHADPKVQAEYWSQQLRRTVPPRYEASRQQRSRPDGTDRETVRSAQLVPAGTVLTSTIAFDRLTPLQLESLLAALEPARLLAEPGRTRRYATHLGGGKPFGLGSVTTSVVCHAVEVATRYGPSPQAHTPGASAPRDLLADRVGLLRLDELSMLLDLDGLGDEEALVAYPPGAPWTAYRDPADNRGEFEQSYQFFQWATGEVLDRGPRPWHPLPRPGRGRSQKLPMPPAKQRKGRP